MNVGMCWPSKMAGEVVKKRKHNPMPMMEFQRVYVAIDGNIGVGKSTVIKNLRGFFKKIPEPVGKFSLYKSNSGKTFYPLERSYEAPTTESVMAQIHIIRESCAYYREQLSESMMQMNVSERSINSPRVFINAKARVGHMSEYSKESLLDMHKSLTGVVSKYKPHTTIYLRCEPEVAYNRVQRRIQENGLQDGDCKIDLPYLRALHEEYEEFYMRNPQVENVVMIDVSELSPAEVVPKMEPIFERFERELQGNTTTAAAQDCCVADSK